MSTYRLSHAANDDISHIFFEGLRLFGAAQANKYHDGLLATFEFLADHPRAARLREETDSPYRAWSYNAHVVVYDLDEGDGSITIVRVRHGREDWLTQPIQALSGSMPGLVAVAVGAFADPSFPAPAFSVWEERKHEWVAVTGDGVEHWG